MTGIDTLPYARHALEVLQRSRDPETGRYTIDDEEVRAAMTVASWHGETARHLLSIRGVPDHVRSVAQESVRRDAIYGITSRRLKEEAMTNPQLKVFAGQLVVTPVPGSSRRWRLVDPIEYHPGGRPSKDVVVVPAGFVTDFASVPRVLWPLVPPMGRYCAAAVVHDWLYSYAGMNPSRRGEVTTRAWADRVFLEAMAELGTRWWRRWSMYWSVRLFSRRAWRRWRALPPTMTAYWTLDGPGVRADLPHPHELRALAHILRPSLVFEELCFRGIDWQTLRLKLERLADILSHDSKLDGGGS